MKHFKNEAVEKNKLLVVHYAAINVYSTVCKMQ